MSSFIHVFLLKNVVFNGALFPLSLFFGKAKSPHVAQSVGRVPSSADNRILLANLLAVG